MKTLKSIIAALSAVGLSTGTANTEEILGTWIDRVQVAYENAYDEECDPAYDTLKQSLSDSEFENNLKPIGRAMIHRAIIYCAAHLEDKKRARQGFEDWRALGLENQAAWSYRWQTFQEAGWDEPERAMTALASWLETGEELSGRIQVRMINTVRASIVDNLDDEAQARAVLRLFGLIETSNFVFPEPQYDRSYDHKLEARAHAELGDMAAAKVALEKITDPEVLVETHTLVRDEALRVDGFDLSPAAVKKLYDQDLVRKKTKLDAQPEYLRRYIDVALVMRQLGDEAGAIALLEDATSRLGQEPAAYKDESEEVNWAYNELAYALFNIGEIDRGVNTFRKGITSKESGSQNVSQIINLAASLKYTGRFDEAIAVLSAMGKASPFGNMFEQSIKACAAHKLGDADAAATHLAYVVENKDDNVSALMETYVCMGMEDEAAALLIERLEDHHRADRALWSMHRRLPDPVQQDYHETLKATYARIHGRDDVQAAAAEVGTIIDLPIYNTYWGNG